MNIRRLLLLPVILGTTLASGTALLSQKLAYKGLELITPKPLDMDPVISLQCDQRLPRVTGVGQHYAMGSRYYRVYVNPRASTAMHRGGTFPTGSVIVKEKLTKDGNAFNVELLTVMEKGKAGSNPSAHDWDFYVAKADGTRTTTSGQVSNCVSCHQDRMAKDDMVFRTYVSYKKASKQP